MPDYLLVCTLCAATVADDGARLACPNDHAPALLRSVYRATAFEPAGSQSILRYERWLPGVRRIETGARTAVYRSTALGAHLGLRRLWIAFSGWWPERSATLPTGTFKDLEAVAVLRRRSRSETRTLVIASAGNTALAFARACTDNAIPALIVVPLRAWDETLRTAARGACVQVVAIAGASYDDAIAFARELCAGDDFVLEGGVRNIARRDGMGTALLAAVEAIGELPDFYFQAVGSAAGALAAHEAGLRIIADGRYGTQLPRLMLSQNQPFTPIHDAWQAGSPQLIARSETLARQQAAAIGAFVLSNAAPPYGIAGGIFEALSSSNGLTFAIDNAEMGNALSLFSELEGIAVEPAAGVAIASLVRAVARGDVRSDDCIVVHVTGGGRQLLRAPATPSEPTLVVERRELATTALHRTRSIVV